MMPEHPTVPVRETGALQTSASTEALYVTEPTLYLYRTLHREFLRTGG